MILKEGARLKLPDQVLVDRALLNHFFVLKILGQVNAVIFTDILHGLRRKQTGMGQDTHGIEDVTAGLKITGECAIRYAGQSGQLSLANEFVLVVIIDHETEYFYKTE
jgi:hypothetical protein